MNSFRSVGYYLRDFGMILAAMSFLSLGTGLFETGILYRMIAFGLCQLFSGLIIIHKLSRKEEQ